MTTTTFENREKRVFGDFEIDCVSRDDLVKWCQQDIQSGHPTRLIMDVNGHGLSLARTDRAYRDMIKQADVIHADGGFLVLLSKRLRGPAIPERSATTDMLHDFAKAFETSGHSFYVLGSQEEVNAQCCDKLGELYPDLKIAGRRNGYFTEADEDAIIDDINASGADVLWLGMGKPLEQKIALKWRDRVNATWIITCGGCFNYVTGHYQRAPEWMQNNNLEWLHRLAHNPKQLFWRYAITTPHALCIALTK